jgi:hypothetical protein
MAEKGNNLNLNKLINLFSGGLERVDLAYYPNPHWKNYFN